MSSFEGPCSRFQTSLRSRSSLSWVAFVPDIGLSREPACQRKFWQIHLCSVGWRIGYFKDLLVQKLYDNHSSRNMSHIRICWSICWYRSAASCLYHQRSWPSTVKSVTLCHCNHRFGLSSGINIDSFPQSVWYQARRRAYQTSCSIMLGSLHLTMVSLSSWSVLFTGNSD